MINSSRGDSLDLYKATTAQFNYLSHPPHVHCTHVFVTQASIVIHRYIMSDMVPDSSDPSTQSNMPVVDYASLPTPSLSPDVSADPSPAFATVLRTPDAVDVEGFNFNIGEPAVAVAGEEQAITAVAPPIPECWGHRGVRIHVMCGTHKR